ncbi:flagellar motor switch protein FliG [Thermithiobacillus plumbiphilus]|uniref:Flagellar motor switch protein FliG n=1 Tax=Thermithiobacillus plumbiphilus TaxID=1729899 RepID=A0ABU9DAK7_9PROT
MGDNAELSGVERSAILLLSLGEDDAAEVMRYLSPKEVQKLGITMAALQRVSREEAELVLRDFRERLERMTALGVGTDQYIRNMLTKALGQDKANNLIERILHGGEASGLENLKWMDARAVAELIRLEHPQVVAMVLAYMEPDQAAEVVQFLPERLRKEALLRVATLESVQPGALRELNEIFEQQLSGSGDRVHVSSLGGIKAAADIINKLEGATSTRIMDGIKDQDGDLAQKIQDQMFVFDDLIGVDDRGIQALLRDIPSETLIFALKGANGDLRDKFFKNMSKRAAEMLRDDLEAKGPVRVSEVEGAQKEILAIAMRLEAAGQIALGGSGEAMI